MQCPLCSPPSPASARHSYERNGVTVPHTSQPICYTLRFPLPATHYVEVEGIIPTNEQPTIELAMAVWTPGSYLVREFARHVESVTATTPDGKPLPIDKSRKNRWCIQA